MDEHRFDEFTKVLASGSTRRQALRGLLALALGGGLGLGRLARADAARCKPGKKCKANTPGAGSCGDAGLVCENGRLACPTVANATASFTHGACQYACQAGFADCDGDIPSNGCEVETNDDPANCGGCGTACDDSLECCNGACTHPDAYQHDDSANCGGCGIACASGSACFEGGCIDVQDDVANCGAVHHDCRIEYGSDDYYCENGACLRLCGGEEGCADGDCYYECHDPICGATEGQCRGSHEVCCPSHDLVECFGEDTCPSDTQRFIDLV